MKSPLYRLAAPSTVHVFVFNSYCKDLSWICQEELCARLWAFGWDGWLRSGPQRGYLGTRILGRPKVQEWWNYRFFYRKIIGKCLLKLHFSRSHPLMMKQGWDVCFSCLGFSVASAVNLRLSTNDQHGAPEVIGSDMRVFSVLVKVTTWTVWA